MDLKVDEFGKIVELKSKIMNLSRKFRKLMKSARKHKTYQNIHMRRLIQMQQDEVYKKYSECDDCRQFDRDMAEIEQEIHRLEQIEAYQRATVKELVKQVKTKTEIIGDWTHANLVLKHVIDWNKVSNPLARGSYRRKCLQEEAKRKEEEKKLEKRKEEKRKQEEKKRMIKEQRKGHPIEFKKTLKSREASGTLSQPSTLAEPSTSFLTTTKNGGVRETSTINRHGKEKKKRRSSEVPAAESEAMVSEVSSTKPRSSSKEEKDKKDRMQ